jgi:hypothetical protein
MKIEITRSAEQELSIKKTFIKTLYSKYIKMHLITTLMGLTLLFWKDIFRLNNVPFWNLASASGLGFVILGLYRLLDFYKVYQKAKSIEQSSGLLILTEHGITYDQKNATVNYKWPFFTYYAVNKTCILLYAHNSKTNPLIISLNELSEEQYFGLTKMFYDNQIIKK